LHLERRYRRLKVSLWNELLKFPLELHPELIVGDAGAKPLK